LDVPSAEANFGLDPVYEHDVYNPFDRGLTLNELTPGEALANVAQFGFETLIDESIDYVTGTSWVSMGIGVLEAIQTPANTFGKARILWGESPEDLKAPQQNWFSPPYKEIGIDEPLYLGISLATGTVFTKLHLRIGYGESDMQAYVGPDKLLSYQEIENTNTNDIYAPYFYGDHYFFTLEMPLLFHQPGYYSIRASGEEVKGDWVIIHVRDNPRHSYAVVSLDETQRKLYLHVYDAEGQHVGMDNTGIIDVSLPEAYYFDLDEGRTVIVLPSNMSVFQTLVDARYAEDPIERYTLTETLKGNSELYTESCSRMILQGENQTFQTEVTETSLDLHANPLFAIRILSPQNNKRYSNSVPMIFDASEDISSASYSLDNQTNVTIDSETVIEVPDGMHQLVLFANDTSGHWASSQTVNFQVNSSSHIPWEVGFLSFGQYPITAIAGCSGRLYATADGAIYVYDGNRWTIHASPSYISSLFAYQNVLVLGGRGGLYLLNDTVSGMVFSVPTYIEVLGVFNGSLYAGTCLDKEPSLYYCSGSVNNPSDWQLDVGFSEVLNFSGPFGSIDSFAVYDGMMYVTSGGTIYASNGNSWVSLKRYDDIYSILDMQVYDGKLYLATRDQGWRKPLYQGGTGFSGRVIEFDGENWTAVFDHDYWIFSLEIYNDNLYAGTANRIFTYNGADWEVSFNTTEGAYYAISMITYDGKIYAGMGNGYIFADPAPAKANPETIVVPEFPSTAILAVLMALTMLAAALTRKSRTKRFD
jgi:hypothetical protein